MATDLMTSRIVWACWTVIVLTVFSAVLAEPGGHLPHELAVEEEEETMEGFRLLPGESLSSRVKREYTNNRAARRRVFKHTDLNGDGLVTRKEYVMQNGNMTDEELDILFGAFDVDGDRSLSQDEFVRHGFLWVVAQECELEAIQRCDQEFVFFIRIQDPAVRDGQQGTLCRALQSYFDCIEHERVTCDMTSYSQAVIDLVANYQTSHFCPDLNFAGLLSMPSPDDTGDQPEGDLSESSLLQEEQDTRQKRSVKHGHGRHRGFQFPWWTTEPRPGDDSCTHTALKSCTITFDDELRRTNDFCTSLIDYRHCVTRSARTCGEFELLEVEASLKRLIHIHRKLGMC